jgi:ferredoxin
MPLRDDPVLRIVCLPPGWTLVALPGETVLDAALRSQRPLASSCGGSAVCGDCLVRIVAGHDHADPPTDDERAWRMRRSYVGAERLACCRRIGGPVEVTTCYW